MIHDVDETIKELLVQKMPLDPTAVDVRFEMPTKEWAAGLLKPTLNVFLYDVRENRELRSNERYFTRTGETTGTSTRAPVHIDLTYLITAWVTEVSDEHRLLGRTLLTLLRFPTLPPEVLKGALQTASLPAQAWTALPDKTPHAWDFWGILENRLKASISYVLTTVLEPFAPEVFGPLVATKVLHVHEGVEPTAPDPPPPPPP